MRPLKVPVDPLRPLLVDRLGFGDIALGFTEALVATASVAIPAAGVVSQISPASPALLEQSAEIGVVLVLAFVLEAVWLVPRFSRMDNYEVRLGAITGLGVAGMVGVTLALLTAAHRAAGHDNWLDSLALGWIAPSLLGLAGLVVLQPLLVHDWERPHAKTKTRKQVDRS